MHSSSLQTGIHLGMKVTLSSRKSSRAEHPPPQSQATKHRSHPLILPSQHLPMSNVSLFPEGRNSLPPESSDIQNYVLLRTNSDALFMCTLPYHSFDVSFAAKLNFKFVSAQQLLLKEVDPWCMEDNSKSDVKKTHNPLGGTADWEVLHSRSKLPMFQLSMTCQSPWHIGFQLKPPVSKQIFVRDTVLESLSQPHKELCPII